MDRNAMNQKARGKSLGFDIMTSDEKLPRISMIRIAVGLAAIVGGLTLFVYGEFDDSPGGQALGALIVFSGSVDRPDHEGAIARVPSSRLSRFG